MHSRTGRRCIASATGAHRPTHASRRGRMPRQGSASALSYPGRFQAGQLRTLQRRFRDWRALRGEGREVYFAQCHRAGEQSQSDFTVMRSLGVTISGIAFAHLVYHFVLTYSNWESVRGVRQDYGI